MAVTKPGSPVGHICGAQVAQAGGFNTTHTEAIVIDELLPYLGLGKPPSPQQIPSRSRAIEEPTTIPSYRPMPVDWPSPSRDETLTCGSTTSPAPPGRG